MNETKTDASAQDGSPVRSTGLICGCYWWEQAQKSGSDNEGYGALASKYGGEWKIGSIDWPVTYCPWCGNLLPHITPND